MVNYMIPLCIVGRVNSPWEQHNAPCYFKDFMAQANEYQLAYLGEANFIEMLP